MKTAMLILFALLAVGEGIHITICYLRVLKDRPPLKFSRLLHWVAAAALFTVWFLWNGFRISE